MIQLNPKDPGDTPFKLKRALKESGLSLQQVCDLMKSDYDVEMTTSAFDHSWLDTPATGFADPGSLWCE